MTMWSDDFGDGQGANKAVMLARFEVLLGRRLRQVQLDLDVLHQGRSGHVGLSVNHLAPGIESH